jgi:hypothetical protein
MQLEVPYNVYHKIAVRHSNDLHALDRLGEILVNCVYIGRSAPDNQRIEVYTQLDGIWYVVVIRPANERTPVHILITLHRLYGRKVEARLKKGRIASLR